MRVARRGLDVCVIKRPLYQLRVTGLTQQFGPKVVPEIMESKIGNPAAFLILRQRVLRPLTVIG